MTFEKTLARFRKVSETLEELKDALVALTGERDRLEHEILFECNNDVSKYNVFVRNNGAAGLDGREYFKVTFSDALVRARRGVSSRMAAPAFAPARGLRILHSEKQRGGSAMARKGGASCM